MFVIDVRDRCFTRRQRVVLQDQSGIRIEEDDLIRPGKRDRAVVEDVQVGIADPTAGNVGVVDVGAPNLFARGGVGLRDKGAGGTGPVGGG